MTEATNLPVATNGLLMDGTNDSMKMSWVSPSGTPSNCTILMGLKTTDTSFYLTEQTGGGRTYGLCIDGSTSTNIGSGAGYYVDGVYYQNGVSTRNALRDAIATGSWKRVEVRNDNISAATTGFQLNGNAISTATKMAGNWSAYIVINEGALGGDAATAVAMAQDLIDDINAALP